MSAIDDAKPSLMPPLLEGGVAEAVVGGALLGVRQMLIGFVEFLEPRLGLLVAGMAVGMALHRRLAEGGLQLRVGRGLGDAEGFVEIAFGHRQRARSLCIRSDLLSLRRVSRGGPCSDAKAGVAETPARSSAQPRRPPSRRPLKAHAGRPRSGRLHSFSRLLLVVVDFVEVGVDDVVLGLAAPASAPPSPGAPPPAGPCTWPRRASSAPASGRWCGP